MNMSIKNLVKKICSADSVILTDHDLNITVLDPALRSELKGTVESFEFKELNRVIGYFIEELEGDGISMDDDEMDNPESYLSFCIEECDQTVEDLQEYINEFKTNNLE